MYWALYWRSSCFGGVWKVMLGRFGVGGGTLGVLGAFYGVFGCVGAFWNITIHVRCLDSFCV